MFIKGRYSKLALILSLLPVVLLLSSCMLGDRLPPTIGETLKSEKVSGVDWPQPFKQALAFYFDNQCDAAWEVLWPLAKQGDNNARYMLAEAQDIGLGCGIPGKYEGDDGVRRGLTLEAYALSAPHMYSMDGKGTIQAFFRQNLSDIIPIWYAGSDAKKVAACYASNATSKVCLDQAVYLGLFKTFDRFAKDIDEAKH